MAKRGGPPYLAEVLNRLILVMVAIGVLGFLGVNMRSCTQPPTGLEAYARGSLQRLTSLDAPPVQPALTFRDAEGAEMRLEDFRGRKVLLNVWATWCAPCVVELPTLEAVARERDDIEVVTISLDRRPEDAAEFLAREGFDLPEWWDASFSLPGKLAAPGLPITILYNEGGREVGRLAGEANWTSLEADALLDYFAAQ